MPFARSIPIPSRLSPQVWLLTIPAALASFERRQSIPRLPVGRLRFAGVPIALIGAGIVAWSWRTQGRVQVKAPPSIAPLARRPSLLGGLIAIAGAGLFMRSTLVIGYAIALAVAAAAEAIEVEEPTLESLAGVID